MAKEIFDDPATAKGKEARQYFIQVEKEYKTATTSSAHIDQQKLPLSQLLVIV